MAARTFDGLLARYPIGVASLAREARGFILELLPEAEETVDSSSPVVGYGYGAGYAGVICTLLVSKSGVKLGLARGAEIPDPAGLLEGKGRVHRYVALRSAADLRKREVKALVRAAAAAWRKRTGERR